MDWHAELLSRDCIVVESSTMEMQKAVALLLVQKSALALEQQPSVHLHPSPDWTLRSGSNGLPHGPDVPQLPQAPLLALDEVSELELDGPPHGLGRATGSVALSRMGWAFDCHFPGDPVLPGTLMLEAMLQLLGVLAVAHGFRGRARAAGLREIRFRHAVTPGPGALTLAVAVRRLSRPSQMLVADGEVRLGDIVCASAKGMTMVVARPAAEACDRVAQGERRVGVAA
jgi:3-hydroxyacyl-[acyl-carrier protein] dehydratase/trans-2-decenoyl-[acyl-carrier protein] isomerase